MSQLAQTPPRSSTVPLSLAPGQSTSKPSRPRSFSRPPPIIVDRCRSPTDLEGNLSSFNHQQSQLTPSKYPVERLDSPAFLKGDLNFTTFRERAARAIAEWGPSPVRLQFPSTATPTGPLTPRQTQPTTAVPDAFTHHDGLSVPGGGENSSVHSLTPSPPHTPFTPLTPGPYSHAQHREQSVVNRRSSLKHRRPRPRPLQLKPSDSSGPSEKNTGYNDENSRNVRFADGPPLRGSTWHITQYPARLASPPISAANLSLADLVELEAIKQSLGTWCGEIMGSPIRGSFSQSSFSSLSGSEGHQQIWADSRPASAFGTSFTSSPISCPELSPKDEWGRANWPDSPTYESDCNSEIFEGMH